MPIGKFILLFIFQVSELLLCTSCVLSVSSVHSQVYKHIHNWCKCHFTQPSLYCASTVRVEQGNYLLNYKSVPINEIVSKRKKDMREDEQLVYV